MGGSHGGGSLGERPIAGGHSRNKRTRRLRLPSESPRPFRIGYRRSILRRLNVADRDKRTIKKRQGRIMMLGRSSTAMMAVALVSALTDAGGRRAGR